MAFTIARLITIFLLFSALDHHPYGYYTMLRFFVCCVTAYGAYFAMGLQKKEWGWSFGIIAVLFNPFIPVRLSRTTWAVIDSSVAFLLIVSVFFLQTPNPGRAKNNKASENSRS